MNAAHPESTRIESIDLLRGITILVMLFVNDVAGVQGAPPWMKHVSPPQADGMTFVDIVFPAFLFIVGMSIPFALRARLAYGRSILSVWGHIMARTFALLVIGVLMVNTEHMSDAGLLPRPLWSLLMYIGVILIWNRPSGNEVPPERLQRFLRWGGMGLLVVLAVLYRGPGEPGLVELRTYWWGILGLIGWAYLVGCLVYIPLRNHPVAVLGAAALLYFVSLADAVGAFSWLGVAGSWVDVGSALGSHGATTVTGIVLGMMLLPESGLRSHGKRLTGALLYGLGLWAAAVLLHQLNTLHPIFYYNKIAATPPWGLLSSAVTVGIWAGLYAIVDVLRVRRWTFLVEPAGRNALFAYVLAPVVYAMLGLVALGWGGYNPYWDLGSLFVPGLLRAIVFAFAMTWLAGALARLGIRLRL